MVDTQKNIGLKIKEVRLERGMSQIELAKLLDCDKAFLSRIESGKQNLTLKTIEEIANVLNVSVFDLLGEIQEDQGKGNGENKIKVIDLFAGVGGLSYGFAKNKNFKIVLANEIDPNISKAYSLNHPSVMMVNEDIKKLDDDFFNKKLKEKIDLVVGGPPCQSYSTLGKRRMDDRANLFKEYCRVLRILKPKAFIFENVSGLLSMQKGELIKIIEKEFNELGYSIKSKLLNAVDFGVPQYRERIIIVGVLGSNEFEYPHPMFFDPKEGKKPFYRTVADALSDLPALKSGEEKQFYASDPQNDYQEFLRSNSNILLNNNAPKNGTALVKLMEALPDGGTKEDLPTSLRPKSGYGNTYAKMWWNKPAPTITRNFGTPSSSRCIHPRDSRALSTREGARLQSFPDDYKFYGSRAKENLEIGNAVPPLLSIALADQILKLFKNYKEA